MDLQEIRDAVRDQMDVDETELPNGHLDLWILDGYTKAIQTEIQWPFFASEWSVTVAADESTIAVPADVREIASIFTTYGRIARIDVRDGEDYFGLSVATTQPPYWSQFGSAVRLWPAASAELELTLRGWRKPSDWMAGGAGAEVDADDRLHLPIVMYVLSKCYYQQEDEVLGDRYERMFYDGVSSAKTSIMEVRSGPKILGGAADLRMGRGRGYPYGGDNVTLSVP